VELFDVSCTKSTRCRQPVETLSYSMNRMGGLEPRLLSDKRMYVHPPIFADVIIRMKYKPQVFSTSIALGGLYIVAKE
jgi:hypothetical protein